MERRKDGQTESDLPTFHVRVSRGGAMRVLHLSLIAGLCLLGCGRKANGPLEGAALRAKQEPLLAKGDTAGLANLALDQCRWLSREPKQTCYENYFVALSDSGRV